MELDIGGKYALKFVQEGHEVVLRIPKVLLEHLQRDMDRIFKLKPMSDEELSRIISDQCCLTGWKVPPTRQVARAVEKWHGIEDDTATPLQD
jgi:hypothetical protein